MGDNNCNPLFIAFENDEQRREYLLSFCESMEAPINRVGKSLRSLGHVLDENDKVVD